MTFSWPDLLSELVAGRDLSAEQARWAMSEVFAGAATPVQVAGLAVALRAKGETVDEVAGIAEAMLEAANPISVPGRLLDIVGTGGDRAMSVNISSMSAIVAAGAGATVVKHGNRSASSKSGSADVLEALGIRLDLTPEQVAAVASEAGITFCFSAAFHPAMRHAAVPRRELGIATAFNILGPLTNPARPQAQAIGCADASDGAGDGGCARSPRRRRVGLPRRRRPGRAHDDHHLDGVGGARRLGGRVDGGPRRVRHRPGRAPMTCAAVRCPTTPTSVRRLLDGETGAVRDAVLLNAGAALAVYDDPGADLAPALAAGIAKAAEAVDSGAAKATLERWVAATSR